MSEKRLHGWFKPKFMVEVCGRDWISDGVMALEWATDTSLNRVPRGALDSSVGAATQDVGAERVNGWVRLGAQAFADHLVAIVEDLFPGCRWRVKPGAEFDPAVAFLDGRPVGMIMPVRDWSPAASNPGPRCPACDGEKGEECEACEGHGTKTCPECDGEGETTCHHCEQDMDCKRCGGSGDIGKCDACKGTGFAEECKACGGTGRWKAPVVEAA